MKFDIHNRFTRAVQFTAEIDCEENTSTSIKIGLAVRWAVKSGANLNHAKLYGANLNHASGINDHIKCVQIEKYAICYTSEVMQIGCQQHTIKGWSEFSDAQIRAMDGKAALEWWGKYKEWIFQTIALCPAKPTGAK